MSDLDLDHGRKASADHFGRERTTRALGPQRALKSLAHVCPERGRCLKPREISICVRQDPLELIDVGDGREMTRQVPDDGIPMRGPRTHPVNSRYTQARSHIVTSCIRVERQGIVLNRAA